MRSATIKSIHKPTPGHISQKRIHPDLDVQWRLREADNPVRTAPRFGFARVVEENETAGAEVGIGMKSSGRDVRRQGNSERREPARGCNLGNHELSPSRRRTQRRYRIRQGGWR